MQTDLGPPADQMRPLQMYNTIDQDFVDPRDISKGGLVDKGGAGVE